LLPPPNEFNDNTNSCDENLTPVFILVICLFLGLALLPIVILADKYSNFKPQIIEPAPPSTPRVHK